MTDISVDYVQSSLSRTTIDLAYQSGNGCKILRYRPWDRVYEVLHVSYGRRDYYASTADVAEAVEAYNRLEV